MKQIARMGVVLLMASMLSACAVNNPNRHAAIGAGAGAAAGALIGQAASHSTGGTLIGAVVGALAGGAVGHYMDAQQHAMEQRLAKQRASRELHIVRMGRDALRVGVASDYSFAVDSARLTPSAKQTFASIASVLEHYRKTIIHVVGFTDSTGSAQYNRKLSVRRARSVADFLISQGVSAGRMRIEGRGETQPVASNATAAGRARNRRVDVVIKPLIQGHEAQAYAPPGYLGS